MAGIINNVLSLANTLFFLTKTVFYNENTH